MMKVVFDIDGVLADNSKYKEWYNEGVFNREKFFKQIPKLKAIEWAVRLISKLYEDYCIVIVTAREERYKRKTVNWLKKNRIPFDHIHFNKEQELSSHVNYKLNVLKDYEDILFIVEDSPIIVKAYRDNGYMVLQPNHVYEGFEKWKQELNTTKKNQTGVL